jgi:hypothetical protein
MHDMAHYHSDTDTNKTTTSPPSATICKHCKNNLAEIFQVDGYYCLHCWQEITCPNVK